jgi:hypothetical protein
MKANDSEDGRPDSPAAEAQRGVEETHAGGTTWVLVIVAAASVFGYIGLCALGVGSLRARGDPGLFVLVIVGGLAVEALLAYAIARLAGVGNRRHLWGITVAPVVVAAVLTTLLVVWFWWLR